MKLSILQNKLKEGVNIVKNITSKSPILPALNNILLKTEGSFLNLIATDLEIGINWWALAKIEQEGEIAIPAKIFSDFISLLPDKTINLSIKNNILSIDAENYQTKIKGVGSENFPIIPKTEREQWALIESYPFCQGLSQVVEFTAPSTTRPEISGVYICLEKNLLTMAATDSFRLGEKKLFLKKASNITQKHVLILPQKTTRELINIFGEKESKIKIYFGANQIMFERDLEETQHPQIQFVSKLIEGEYPQYSDIIPKKYKTQAILKKDEFLSHIKTASLFSGRINEVKIKFDPSKNQLELFCQNPEIGERRSSFRGKIEGQKGEVSFNHKFLISGLSNIKTPEVIFALSEKKGGEEGPGVFKPVGDESFIYIAMPIQAS